MRFIHIFGGFLAFGTQFRFFSLSSFARIFLLIDVS